MGGKGGNIPTDNLVNPTNKLKSPLSGEAMFKDCKTGGYNLEGSRANPQRLTNLILLIALAYTASVIKGKSIKNLGAQKYIARLTEAKRISKRHSNFWVGLYGNLWVKSLGISHRYCSRYDEFIPS